MLLLGVGLVEVVPSFDSERAELLKRHPVNLSVSDMPLTFSSKLVSSAHVLCPVIGWVICEASASLKTLLSGTLKTRETRVLCSGEKNR